MNIKFYYLYRDFANYKKHNEIVFSNATNKPVEEIERTIREHLIDGEWFYAGEWKVPDLHFENWDSEEDHFLHEFGWVQETNEAPTHNTPINDFVEVVKQAKTHL